MKNSLLILSLALSNLLYAQPAGSIVGTVLDKDLNNEPLPFANILIPEVNVGTTSDFDGLFALDGLAEGDYHCHILALSAMKPKRFRSQSLVVR